MQKAAKADDGVIMSDNLDDDKAVDYIDDVDYSVTEAPEQEITPEEAQKKVDEHKERIKDVPIQQGGVQTEIPDFAK
jgi:hypothetical protein